MADQIWPNALSLRLRAAHCAPFDLILFAVFYFYYSLCTVLAADCRLGAGWVLTGLLLLLPLVALAMMRN